MYRSRLRAVIALLSGLLAVAVLVLWGLSYLRGMEIGWESVGIVSGQGKAGLYLSQWRGQVCLTINHTADASFPRPPGHFAFHVHPPVVFVWPAIGPQGNGWRYGGFDFAQLSKPPVLPGSQLTEVGIPHWAIAGGLAVAPVAWLRRRTRDKGPGFEVQAVNESPTDATIATREA